MRRRCSLPAVVLISVLQEDQRVGMMGEPDKSCYAHCFSGISGFPVQSGLVRVLNDKNSALTPGK